MLNPQLKTRRSTDRRWVSLMAAIGLAMSCSVGQGAELSIGTASADITPDEPVPLTGYRSVRISRSVHSRCTANVLALEARVGDEVVDQAIMVSCDLCVIRPGIQRIANDSPTFASPATIPLIQNTGIGFIFSSKGDMTFTVFCS